MTSGKLVLKNMLRRRGRFVFTLLGIVIGMASFVTFMSLGGSLKSQIERESAALGANLVVTPKGSCAYEQVSILTGEQMPTNINAEEVAAIRAIEGMTAIPYLAERSAIANRPVSVMGVLPEETRRFKNWQLAAGEYFPTEAAEGAVLGAVLAEQFGLQPGSDVRIRGEQIPVLGVLAETGGKDDLTVFLSLPVAQRLYGQAGLVSYVAVRVERLDEVELYANRIRDAVALGVVSDKQMRNSVLSIVGTVNVTLQLIAAVAILAAAFGIVNTMMTATYERRREIGILQAMGATRAGIFRLFLLESGVYGLLGGIGGAALGGLAAVLATPYIGQNAATSFVKGSQSSIDPLTFCGAVLFSTLVAMAAGLYPAVKASKLSPVEAISYE
ncbi:MAG: ABC transporter permease [Desulfuromonas sp.]|uniref:ABC transporter permease n=1 Tax=Desulfuromonas sp. TaxID=892 RepID=UPI000CBE0E48|nr:ABC transporter permease [Desulfuromonas sp.]PLX85576.1 MAG: ABC transporter permease [Desulfuromonas sp.]